MIMIEDDIRHALEARFSPTLLRLTDKSHTHVGHPEDLKQRELLLDLVIVSEFFAGKTLLEKHAAIYKTLDVGKNARIHGITIRAYSPAEWAKLSA